MSAGIAQIKLIISSILSKTIFGVSTDIPAVFGGDANHLAVQLTAGATGPNTYSQRYAATRSLTSGATDTMDLTDGSLLQDTGAAFVAADVVVMGFKAADSNVSDLVIGGGTGAMASILGASGTVTLKPGATFAVACPLGTSAYSVSAHKINVTSAFTASYDVIILSH